MNGSRVAVFALLAALLAGCATSPEQASPQVERLTADELERLLPSPVPNLGYGDLVRLAREGLAPDAMMEKIRQSGSRYSLTPAEAVDLARLGVDVRVLDAMHAAREQALRDGFADEINRREREHKLELESLQRQLLMRPWPHDPFCGPYPPYWPYPCYRR